MHTLTVCTGWMRKAQSSFKLARRYGAQWRAKGDSCCRHAGRMLSCVAFRSAYIICVFVITHMLKVSHQGGLNNLMGGTKSAQKIRFREQAKKKKWRSCALISLKVIKCPIRTSRLLSLSRFSLNGLFIDATVASISSFPNVGVMSFRRLPLSLSSEVLQ